MLLLPDVLLANLTGSIMLDLTLARRPPFVHRMIDVTQVVNHAALKHSLAATVHMQIDAVSFIIQATSLSHRKLKSGMALRQLQC